LSAATVARRLAPAGRPVPQPLAIVCRDVSHRYPNGVQALAGVTLEVRAGEFAAVLGPSGCGKSTLLRLLAGLEAPTAGEVCLLGPEGACPPRPGLAALMPQRDALLPWRRLVDNVALGPELGGLPPGEAARRAAEGLERFGLGAFARAYPAELSGGMRQRAALLRTALAGLGVLLLDEPLGALDSLTRVELQGWLEGVWLAAGEARPTVLLVTHDIPEAVQLADRVFVLSPRPGRVTREVPVPLPRPRPRRLRTDPAAVALQAELEAALAAAPSVGVA
jgi:ABC-type nitrate/sulfonate/bicarbonate transport system ATPase subunit